MINIADDIRMTRAAAAETMMLDMRTWLPPTDLLFSCFR